MQDVRQGARQQLQSDWLVKQILRLRSLFPLCLAYSTPSDRWPTCDDDRVEGRDFQVAPRAQQGKCRRSLPTQQNHKRLFRGLKPPL